MLHDGITRERPRAVIISARGEESFETHQRDRLDAALCVAHHARLAPMEPDEFVNLCKDTEIVALTRRGLRDLDRAILERLPDLRAVSVYATGFEWLDDAAMADRGVLLRTTPRYATRPVAEHGLAMMLAMSRRLHLSHDRGRGLWKSVV